MESKLVLPSHLAHWSGVGRPPTRRIGIAWARFQGRVSERLRFVIENVYAPAVKTCVEWRYLTATTSFAIFAVCASLLMSGHMKTSMMPPMEADAVWARLTMPLGTPVSETRNAIARMVGYWPNTRLTTHENKKVRFYDDLVKGKCVLINFMYTRCDGI